MIKDGPWAGFDAMRIVRQEASFLEDESCFIEVSASGQIFRSPRFKWDSRERVELQDSLLLWRDNVRKQVKVMADGRRPLLTLPKPVTLTLLGRAPDDQRNAQVAATAAIKPKPPKPPEPADAILEVPPRKFSL